MQISGHIVLYLKSEKGSQNTKIPRMLSKISTLERNFKALPNKAVALKRTRMSSYVTSMLWMISEHTSTLELEHLGQYFFIDPY